MVRLRNLKFICNVRGANLKRTVLVQEGVTINLLANESDTIDGYYNFKPTPFLLLHIFKRKF